MMAALTPSSSATEEAGSTPTAPAAIAAAETKEPVRGFLQVGRRNLNEEELSTPAARRFLIAEIERLDQLCSESQTYVAEYHEQRVTIATLTEIGRRSRWNEILSNVCLAVGFAGLGAAPNYLSVAGAERFVWIVIGLALILVVTGIYAKVKK